MGSCVEDLASGLRGIRVRLRGQLCRAGWSFAAQGERETEGEGEGRECELKGRGRLDFRGLIKVCAGILGPASGSFCGE